MIAWSMRCQNQPRFNYAIKMAEVYASKSHDIFDQNLDILNVTNGTIDLKTGQLKPHRREDYLTHQIDVEYDPAAKAPRFMRFLNEIFQLDPELPKFMRTLCGYLATGRINEQIIVTCHGGGANGKSVLWGAINHVLDDIVKHTNYPGFHSMPSDHLACNKAVWDGMPEAHRRIMNVAMESLAFQTSMQVGKGMTAAASKLRGEGVTLHDWSPADRASFRAAAQAAWSDFATTPEAKALLASHVTYLKELGLVD